jgi:hypothetical protein
MTMKPSAIKGTVAVLALLGGLWPSPTRSEQSASVAFVRSAMVGRWRSERPEPMQSAAGTNYLVREFEITRRRWSIRFTVFADEAATKPVLSGHNTGTYRVLATKPTTGVFAAEFAFASRRLTPHVEAMATSLTKAGRSSERFAIDVAQSVYPGGCEPFRVPSRNACARGRG